MQSNHLFYFTPIPSKLNFFIYIIFFFLFLLGVSLILVALDLRTVNSSKILVTDRDIIIRSLFLSKKIPLDSLNLKETKIIFLNKESPFLPKLRIFGISLFSYKKGWFKLKNNKKAWIFITTKEKVVYIPKKDHSIIYLLSPKNPEKFLAILKKRN